MLDSLRYVYFHYFDIVYTGNLYDCILFKLFPNKYLIWSH